jgi:hypothetical protein
MPNGAPAANGKAGSANNIKDLLVINEARSQGQRTDRRGRGTHGVKKTTDRIIEKDNLFISN